MVDDNLDPPLPMMDRTPAGKNAVLANIMLGVRSEQTLLAKLQQVQLAKFVEIVVFCSVLLDLFLHCTGCSLFSQFL